jgi:chemotaxis protein MotB
MSPHRKWHPVFNYTLGSHLFWGCLSLFFATAACFFFWQNCEHELLARTLRDQEATLQAENEDLRGQVNKLQARFNQINQLIKSREDKLKERESNLTSVTEKTQTIVAERLEQEKMRQTRVQIDREMREILRSFASGDDITLIDRDGFPALRISNNLLYQPNEVILKPEARVILKKLAEVIAPRLNKTAIRLESFTDNEPMAVLFAKRYGSNYELSATRAASIARFLIEEAKIPAECVSIVGRGASFPIASNSTKEGRQQNRRLELLLEPARPPAPAPTAP